MLSRRDDSESKAGEREGCRQHHRAHDGALQGQARGPVSLVGVHQVEAMQPGQLIIGVFQLLKTFVGDLLGMSLKHGKMAIMALFLPTSLPVASDTTSTYRTRFELKWASGLTSPKRVCS